jgi:hypothetical protein
MNLYRVEAKQKEDSKWSSTYYAFVLANSDQEAEEKVKEIMPGFLVASQGIARYVIVSDYSLRPFAWA